MTEQQQWSPPPVPALPPIPPPPRPRLRSQPWPWVVGLGFLILVVVLGVTGQLDEETATEVATTTTTTTTTPSTTVTTVTTAPTSATTTVEAPNPTVELNDETIALVFDSVLQLNAPNLYDEIGPAGSKAMADEICRQLNNGDELAIVGVALLATLIERGHSADEAGALFGASISAYCPDHEEALYDWTGSLS